VEGENTERGETEKIYSSITQSLKPS